MVQGIVQKDGSVGCVEVLFVDALRKSGSAGDPGLDSFKPQFEAAAMEAVRHWVFKPATRNGSPTPAKIIVNVDFHL
jgi:hypothetical protein